MAKAPKFENADLFEEPLHSDGKLDLFHEEPVPSTGVVTSDLAAVAIRPLRPGVQRTILRYLVAMHGATCDQVEQACGLRHQTASSALNALEHKSPPLCYRNGDKRNTSHKVAGKFTKALVYYPTAAGRQASMPRSTGG
jgi:hypothetical protein